MKAMKTRRDEKTMLELITSIARNDERIRAVIMNGSRTSPNAPKDIFQDYDIVYLVTDVESFVSDPEWIKQFGDILIRQEPDVMDGKWPDSKNEYAYLVQFRDWNRIDLTLMNINRLPHMTRDSQSILVLDKDGIVETLDAPSDRDYLPAPPTAKAFHDCCVEFFWVATYVAKGIARRELTYAKYMAEQIVKEELIKLMTWHAGYRTHFQLPIGKCGRYLEKYIEPEIWQQFRQTYVDADYENMWSSLFMMCGIFNRLAVIIAEKSGFQYGMKEYNDVIEYLKDVKKYSGMD